MQRSCIGWFSAFIFFVVCLSLVWNTLLELHIKIYYRSLLWTQGKAINQKINIWWTLPLNGLFNVDVEQEERRYIICRQNMLENSAPITRLNCFLILLIAAENNSPRDVIPHSSFNSNKHILRMEFLILNAKKMFFFLHSKCYGFN